MAETLSFPEALRSEYDPEVLDAAQRALRATRLYAALRAAGLWPISARVLDVGCGSGLLLASLGGGDVRQRVGCDLRRALYLRAREQTAGVVFTQCEGTRLPFRSGGFDLAVCLAVIEELSEWQSALEEMARCVAPGGVLYVTVSNGRLLLPLYRLAERLGRRVRASHWAYARSSLRLNEHPPERGLGVPTLAGWRYVHLTPYLARSQWPWLRLLPMRLLDWLSGLAPSFGYAWQRPV